MKSYVVALGTTQFVKMVELKTIEQCQAELGSLDGVMIGRAAYQTPQILFAS